MPSLVFSSNFVLASFLVGEKLACLLALFDCDAFSNKFCIGVCLFKFELMGLGLFAEEIFTLKYKVD